MARGRGIAGRMVSHVARTYLVDAQAQEWDASFEGMPPKRDPTTVFGRKEETCLFVEVTNETARRLYKRIGFEESEDRWGNWDLTGVEAGSW
jgi:ribosomal protein S18 acetylase RimI-like enzyme